ncbi:MAG: hypothetical protein GY715_12895 [Planctomycetes bacterium]|nr:hypothetical protein [Planctomycetota bacterium]
MRTAPDEREAEAVQEPAGETAAFQWLLAAPMRYPNAYVWFVFVSALDIMLTWAILAAGGAEVNPIASRVISAWGLPGAIAFKFSVTIFVILVCEVTGRARWRTGRNLAYLAVGISSVPVIYSLMLLVGHVLVQGN